MITSFELIVSNIPSPYIFINLLLPKTIKSCSLIILNYLISGSAIIIFGFPPNFSNLASISPKVLETDNLPGLTLMGPKIGYPSPLTP